MVVNAERDLGRGRRVTVVGAGFSGLAAAHHLSRAGFDVDVHESTSRAGGLIATKKTERGPVEAAANGLLVSSWVEDLFEAAEVPLLPASKVSKNKRRYIFRDGKPRRWPLKLKETFAVAAFALKVIFYRRVLAPRPEETLRAWGSRVLSPEASRYSIETAFQGIYAGDPSRMSANLLIGRMFGTFNAFLKPTKAPSRRTRHSGTVAPPGGMSELIEGLQKKLSERGVRFRFNSPLSAEDLKQASHPHIITTGASCAAQLLEEADPERAARLREIETLSLLTATLNFPKGTMPLVGFGCLFPPSEANVLGVLLNNSIFSNRSYVGLSETWILGGALFKYPSNLNLKSDSKSGAAIESHRASNLEATDITTLSDAEIVEIILTERERLTGQRTPPEQVVITRRPQALPHFTIEMEKAMREFRPDRRNLFLLGNFTGGIGLAKILEQAAALPQHVANSGQWMANGQ